MKLVKYFLGAIIAFAGSVAPSVPVMALAPHAFQTKPPEFRMMRWWLENQKTSKFVYAFPHGNGLGGGGGGNTYNALSQNLNYAPVPQVYTGCSAPSATTIYYFDGNAVSEGTGTSGSPFRSIQQAMADNEFAEDPSETGTGPIHSPAILMVRNAQGTTGLSGARQFGNNWSNTGWFMIETDPNVGATFGAFLTTHVNKFAFIGNIVSGLWTNSSQDPLFYISTGSHSADVYVYGNTIYGDALSNIASHTTSAPGVVGDTGVTWWTVHIPSGIKIIGSNDNCVTVQYNNVSGVAYGIVTGDTGGSGDPTNTIIAWNVINWFCEDAIDYDDTHAIYANNQITNTVRVDNGHNDGMQRQPNLTDSSDDIIAGNVLIRVIKLNIGDPANPYPGSWQGIDCFDVITAMTLLQVLNNFVIASEQAGIAFYGVNGGTFTGNKVGSDDGTGLEVPSSCSPNCTPAQIETQYVSVGFTNVNQAAGQYVYIFITTSKTSVASNNITLTGNYSNAFYVAPATTSVTASANFGWLTPNGSNNIHVEFGGSTFTTVGAHGGYTIEGAALGTVGGLNYSVCGTYCKPDDVDTNSYGSSGPSYSYNVKTKGT